MKGLFALVRKFGDQWDSGQRKALTKVTALKKHRSFVKLEGKADVNRQSAIYRANKDVKKAFGLPGPQKKGTNVGGPKPMAAQAIVKAAPSSTGPLVPKGSLSSMIRGATQSGIYGTTPQARAALAKVTGLKKHRSLVKLEGNADVNRQGAIYRANKTVKKLFAELAQKPAGAAEFAAPSVRGALSKIFADLKQQGFKAPTAGELVNLAKSQGLETHKLFVKATGIQVSPNAFKAQRTKDTATITNPHVKSSVLYYTGSGYQTINGALRKKNVRDPKSKMQNLDQHVAQHVANIDAALSKAKLAQDTKLYRGMSAKVEDYFAKLKPGSIVTDHGYGSTSAFKDNAFGGKVNLVIHASKGMNVMAIPSGIPSEKEFLLPRGYRMKVLRNVKKTGYSGDKHELHVQLIKPAPQKVTPPKYDPTAPVGVGQKPAKTTHMWDDSDEDMDVDALIKSGEIGPDDL